MRLETILVIGCLFLFARLRAQNLKQLFARVNVELLVNMAYMGFDGAVGYDELIFDIGNRFCVVRAAAKLLARAPIGFFSFEMASQRSTSACLFSMGSLPFSA